MQSIKIITNIIILNIRYILFSSKKIWMILFIFFSSLLIPLIFIPIRFCISLVVFLGIILPAAIIYISTTYNWRSGTLKYNLETSTSKYYFYIGTFLTLNIYVFFWIIPMIIFLFIFQELNLLMLNWMGSGMEDTYCILKLNWGILSYSLFEIALVTFSFMFFFQNIIKSEKGMYLLIMIVCIFSIVFGGVFNNSFASTPTPIGSDNTIRKLTYRENIYGESLYYPIAFLFPFFGPMQHLASLKWSINISNANSYYVEFFIWQGNVIDSWTAWHWDVLWILPYLHTILFGSVAITISYLNKK